MAVENGDADGGCGNSHIGRVQNFARFVDHFHFFFGVVVVAEHVDLRQAVCEDLVIELFGRDAVYAVFKVVLALNARAGNRLISAVNHSFNSIFVVEGF